MKTLAWSLRAILALLIVVIAAACKKDEPLIEVKTVDAYPAETALKWNELFLEIDRYAPGYRPPAAARMLAYTGLAVYESAVPGMPEYQSLAALYPGLTIPVAAVNENYHWPVVVNAVYGYMLSRFFPHIREDLKQKIESLEQSIYAQYSSSLSEKELDESRNYGLSVARAVFEYAKSDEIGQNGYRNPQPANYLPPVGPGKWKPTPPDFAAALFPYWGEVRPFAIKPADMTGRPPLAYSESPSSPLYVQANEVYAMTQEKNSEWQWIGEFWSDDIFELTFEPAARWVAIANQVVSAEQADLAKAVVTYAKLGMALCDGGIVTWHNKYLFNIERPVTYINRLIDPNWTTTLNNPLSGMKGVSPPFPAYPSGHSTFGAAAAEILTSEFGFNYSMTDRCHETRVEFNGKPRTFNNFYEMAEENAISRIYLGVHFRMDCTEGLRIGYLAGRRVNELPWKL